MKKFDLMSGSPKDVMDTTNNDSVFRKARKMFLESAPNGIHCSYCRYHRGENRTVSYGGFIDFGTESIKSGIRYPSWKLASRNRKQWMGKNRVVEISETIKGREGRAPYTWIEFEIGKGKGRKNSIKYYKQ